MNEFHAFHWPEYADCKSCIYRRRMSIGLAAAAFTPRNFQRDELSE